MSLMAMRDVSLKSDATSMALPLGMDGATTPTYSCRKERHAFLRLNPYVLSLLSPLPVLSACSAVATNTHHGESIT